MSSHDDDDERKEEKNSLTLTDINDDVLDMLRQNVTTALYNRLYLHTKVGLV